MKTDLSVVSGLVGVLSAFQILIGGGLLFTSAYDRRSGLFTVDSAMTTTGYFLLTAGCVGLIGAFVARTSNVAGAILTTLMGVLFFMGVRSTEFDLLSVFCLPIGLAAFIMFKHRMST